jgi:hypothetical protein
MLDTNLTSWTGQCPGNFDPLLIHVTLTDLIITNIGILSYQKQTVKGALLNQCFKAGLRQEEQTKGGQKLKDYKVILGDIQFRQMCKEANTRAPMIVKLLSELIAPKTKRKDRPPRDPSKFNHRIAIVAFILCYSLASEEEQKVSPRLWCFSSL